MSQSFSLKTDSKQLTKIVLDLRKLDKEEKRIKEKKSERRTELFHVATVENSQQVLPRKTMQLPVGFLNRIGMQENDYLTSRYPGWRKVQSRKLNDNGDPDRDGRWIEYLLERDPEFLPYSVEIEDESGFIVTAGRTIQQKSPEIDQRSLQKDLPEVFDAIMKPVVQYEVDAVKLEALLGSQPELLPQIERHFSFPAPITKLASIKEIEPDG